MKFDSFYFWSIAFLNLEYSRKRRALQLMKPVASAGVKPPSSSIDTSSWLYREPFDPASRLSTETKIIMSHFKLNISAVISNYLGTQFLLQL